MCRERVIPWQYTKSGIETKLKCRKIYHSLPRDINNIVLVNGRLSTSVIVPLSTNHEWLMSHRMEFNFTLHCSKFMLQRFSIKM